MKTTTKTKFYIASNCTGNCHENDPPIPICCPISQFSGAAVEGAAIALGALRKASQEEEK